MPELPEVETIRRQLLEMAPFAIKKIDLSSKVHSILQDKNGSLIPKAKRFPTFPARARCSIFIWEKISAF